MSLPISAMVVGLNEAELLENCLTSIGFCNEILYFDLVSTDNSVTVAQNHNAKIFNSERVSFGEIVVAKNVSQAKNDWILLTDPDEVTDKDLADQIEKILSSAIPENVGCISVPIIYYYKNKALKGTRWANNTRIYLFHKERFELQPFVHGGRRLKDGYTNMSLQQQGNNVIHHYWMRDFKQLLEKHKRYLAHEGLDRYNLGRRTKLIKVILTPAKEFASCFFKNKGYKDGFTGFFLSSFWAWYETKAKWSLYKVQLKEQKRGKSVTAA